MEHWFWLTLTTLAVIWYCTMTLYVAVRGAADIRGMLKRLGDRRDA